MLRSRDIPENSSASVSALYSVVRRYQLRTACLRVRPVSLSLSLSLFDSVWLIKSMFYALLGNTSGSVLSHTHTHTRHEVRLANLLNLSI